MNKLIYDSPAMNIVIFHGDDVISASYADVTRDPDKPIELPFVPFEPKNY
ncbi:MAG: hypothetical protein IJA62_01740 [Ruminococcus sp.]|nr:hypothetical protein [Ruminococcus sp.]